MEEITWWQERKDYRGAVNAQVSATAREYPDGSIEYDTRVVLGLQEEEIFRAVARRLLEAS
jgi:hypothetical protein